MGYGHHIKDERLCPSVSVMWHIFSHMAMLLCSINMPHRFTSVPTHRPKPNQLYKQALSAHIKRWMWCTHLKWDYNRVEAVCLSAWGERRKGENKHSYRGPAQLKHEWWHALNAHTQTGHGPHIHTAVSGCLHTWTSNSPVKWRFWWKLHHWHTLTYTHIYIYLLFQASCSHAACALWLTNSSCVFGAGPRLD